MKAAQQQQTRKRQIYRFGAALKGAIADIWLAVKILLIGGLLYLILQSMPV